MWRWLFLFFVPAATAWTQAVNQIGFSIVGSQQPMTSLVLTQDPEPSLSTPPLLAGDALLAIDETPIYVPADLQRPQFCKGTNALIWLNIFRPSMGTYLKVSALSKAPSGCLEIQTSDRLITRPVLEVGVVMPQSIANSYGMQAGDILLEAGNHPLVGSPEEMVGEAERLGSQIASIPGFGLMFSRHMRIFNQTFHVAAVNQSANVVATQPNTTPQTSLSASPQPSSSIRPPSTPAVRPVSNPVVVVQQFIRSEQQNHTLAVTGNWDAETLYSLGGLIEALKKNALGEPRWEGPVDGLYSDDFAAYLERAVETRRTGAGENQQFAEQLEGFVLAMNDLKRSGIYKEDQLKPEQAPPAVSSPSTAAPAYTPSTSREDSGDAIMGSFLWFANGALSEFGDEMFCGIFHGQQSFSACHRDARTELDRFNSSNPLFSQICYFAGTFVNPITIILIAFGRNSEMNPGGAIILGLGVGFVDFFLYTLGDLCTKWSFREVDYAQMLASSVIAALLTAFAIATHKEAHNDGLTRHEWKERKSRWWRRW